MLFNFACIFYIRYTDRLDWNVRQSWSYPHVNLRLISNIRAERIKEMAPRKTQRALDLTEKWSSAWLTVPPLQDLGFNLNKREFREAVKLRYDWPVEDIPSTCACGEALTGDHSTICKLGGFITRRHNKLRDLEGEFLKMVCSDVEIEPVLKDIAGEYLNRGSNKAQDARLDIHARGFWERHWSAFVDVRVCHLMLYRMGT